MTVWRRGGYSHGLLSSTLAPEVLASQELVLIRYSNTNWCCPIKFRECENVTQNTKYRTVKGCGNDKEVGRQDAAMQASVPNHWGRPRYSWPSQNSQPISLVWLTASSLLSLTITKSGFKILFPPSKSVKLVEYRILKASTRHWWRGKILYPCLMSKETRFPPNHSSLIQCNGFKNMG